MRVLLLLAVVTMLLVCDTAYGFGRRNRQTTPYIYNNHTTTTTTLTQSTPTTSSSATTVVESDTQIINGVAMGDGLDEVNAKRAQRGLRPFVRDDNLTQAARACAGFRASRGLFGHTSNDFSFVPPGASASSAGCAAYPASYGWLSCCTFENYTYAGAAWVTGNDGKRYMHLFVR